MRRIVLCVMVMAGCGATAGAERDSSRVGVDTPDETRGDETASPADAVIAAQRARAEIVTRPPSAPSRGGVAIGWDGENAYEALGLPAVPEDGASLVYIDGGGDGSNDRYALVTLSAETGATERSDALSESRADEEGTSAERERQQRARTQIADAQRYLAGRAFFTIPQLDGASELRIEDRDGVVTIHDADGRSRFERRMVAAQPRPPADLDDDELEAWEIEHQCDDGIEELEAWRVDATHVFVVLHVGATPDECWVRRETAVVTLAP